MSRVVHTFALLAALVILVSCLWRDYGLLVSVKRVVIAYLGSFFIAGGLVLALRSVATNRSTAAPPAAVDAPTTAGVEDEATAEVAASPHGRRGMEPAVNR